MPPKGSTGKEKMEPDQILAAVLVADSFNKRFMPLTLERPRCLLPLMNVPLIEYTLEFLAVSGVQKIFVVCCAHAEMIKDYIRKSRWANSTLPEVVTIVSQELQSVGDALRDLDSKQLIQSDFILVSGDVISSMNLEKALEEHRTRRLADKSSIMTMVVKKASPDHRSRSRGEEGIFVINPNTHECVLYKELYPRASHINLNLELFGEHPELEFRNDFIDCQIDICSVDVPALFTENFDYQEIRRHFVKGILESDLLGKKIYCHLIEDKYAARVRNTQMYDSISKDIFARWTYPMVPDSNIIEKHTYTHSRPQIYKENDVKLARSAILKGSVLVGSGTSIGEGAVVSQSTIGRNCKIGSNVVLEGAYIWDNVEIADNCIVTRAIVADNVVIGKSSQIQQGSILSFDVKLGPGVVIPRDSKITLKKPDENPEQGDTDLGQGAEGYLWADSFSDDEDDGAHKNLLRFSSLGYDRSEVDNELSDDSLSENELEEDDDEQAGAPENNPVFEIQQTVERAIAEKLHPDNVTIELNTLKMAYNLEFKDLLIGAVKTFMDQLPQTDAEITRYLQNWNNVIEKLIFDVQDQQRVMDILSSWFDENMAPQRKLNRVISLLYNGDILEEEFILDWFDRTASPVRDSLETFVTWLRSAEEEDDDEDDE
ncbi:hypothetical protein HDU97_000073 [Phlyctochytrium planicorne]|nr:hypothetical protein HDU97_000073 [Phlyctochytrium planicorne]